MRIELAKLLLAKNDVLLLDEPTNHLDINSIIWLESFLKEFEGAIIMVSHDRTFLDNITNRTIEIVNGKIYDYPVAYSRFVDLRHERIQIQVFQKVNLEINRNERVAFVGQNGQGKSTLVKIIAERLQHDGHLEIGHNVDIGYYAQEQAKTLDGNKTLLQTIEDAAPEDLRKKARDFLGSFLFTGEDVEKKGKVLSGGEKGRVALCKLLLHPHNLLVMDEPTNHLDMKSKDMLKNALLNYDGTLLVVSHDRHFLQELADKIYEFRDGKVKEFLGNIDEYLEARKFDDFRQVEQDSSAGKAKNKTQSSTNKETVDYQERKQLDKDLRKAEKEVKELEEQIQQLELKLEDLDEQLHDPEKFKELSTEPGFYEAYEADKKKLEKLMELWEKNSEKYHKLNQRKEKLQA
ncbi:ydiF [Symbiodinium sp. CCMP2456]|nr:ydiF [Symbiodinium sp. CCMP2456]